jgi:hypothetical protein
MKAGARFLVGASAFGVWRSALGTGLCAVGTRSRAIRRGKSMKLRSQEMDRPAAVLFDSVLSDRRRRIAQERVPTVQSGAER